MRCSHFHCEFHTCLPPLHVALLYDYVKCRGILPSFNVSGINTHLPTHDNNNSSSVCLFFAGTNVCFTGGIICGFIGVFIAGIIVGIIFGSIGVIMWWRRNEVCCLKTQTVYVYDSCGHLERQNTISPLM